ncbi:uncharacterized protein LOC126910674 [Spodoptera frugiperda]|uniref:Uncharacterized protein LOC126910674 n=1 Tax=Spodoptera frugiperda TaxID=7108 RepID=A0A9R0ET14_SPOFR|nr:uncharacterized protein LOC126910674 [Spodoptera frugiperda]
METRAKKKLRIGSLPGGDRRGTPGADAGRSSIRTIGGSELSPRAPTGSPEQCDSRPSSSTSLFPSLPSSPLSCLNYNTDSSSIPSPISINSATVDVVQEAEAINPAPTTGQVRARLRWTREMNEFIWRTYLYVTQLDTKVRGYLDPLYSKFNEKFPEIKISKQRLGDQKRAILRNKLLPDSLLESIKNEVRSDLQNINNTQDTIGFSQSFIADTHAHNSVNSNTRLRWTDDINEAIIREYFRITHLETNRTAYRKPLHTIITQKFPNIAHVSEQRIADQRRVIINNRLISDDRLEEIKREVRDNLNIQTLENTQYVTPQTYTTIDSNNQQSSSELNETIPHTQDNTQIGNAILQDETRNTVFADETLDTKITKTFEDTYNKYLHTDPTKRPYIPKQKTSKKLAYIIAYLNNTVLPKYGSVEDDFIKTHALVYCAAHTAALCNGSKIKEHNTTITSAPQQNSPIDKRPNWLKRLDRKIHIIRKEIGRMTQYINGNRNLNLITHIERIKHKYSKHSSYEEPNTTDQQFMDSLKQKLTAVTSRRRRYYDCTQRKNQNSQFTNSERQFYRTLATDTTNTQSRRQTSDNLSPDPEQFHTYWSNIWSHVSEHNHAAAWIRDDKQKLENLPDMLLDTIPLEVFVSVITKAHNWKAPGSDNIHNYFYKKFTYLHPSIYNHINNFIKNPQSIPEFITQGLTYMIPKDSDHMNPAKYRPITCLQTIYKLITGCISEIIYKHITQNNILSEEQKGCRKYSQGCKEQLIIDSVAMKHSVKLKNDICTMYVDYQKAFDSVPHSWLVYILQHYKIHPSIIQFLIESMKHWNTKIKLGKLVETDPIPIRRGIFQGDALSPLWFCLALNPLSNLLNSSKAGLTIQGNDSPDFELTHLMFMDDIKLYSNSTPGLHILADLTQTFSDDICMTFGIDKCKTFSLRKGQLIEPNPYILDSGMTIEPMTQDCTYKYLGFEQTYQIDQKHTKNKLTAKYKHRLNMLIRSQLTSRNLIKSINTFAIPVLTYSFGIINWSKADLTKLQRLINTSLTKNRKHHPRSCVQRITLPRDEGGRGLIDVQNLHNQQIINLRNFFMHKSQNSTLHKAISQIDRKYTPLNLHSTDPQRNEHITSKSDKIAAWARKSLHGRHRLDLQQPHVDMKASNAWLRRGELFPETEGFMIAIQDQVIDTANYQKYIIRRPNYNDSCRRCHGASETIQHITGACRAIAQTDYKHRHDQVAAIIHQSLAIQTKLVSDKVPYYKYKPQAVLENEHFKLYWDRTIITDKTIYNNRPDITMLDKQKKDLVRCTKFHISGQSYLSAIALRMLWRLPRRRLMNDDW